MNRFEYYKWEHDQSLLERYLDYNLTYEETGIRGVATNCVDEVVLSLVKSQETERIEDIVGGLKELFNCKDMKVVKVYDLQEFQSYTEHHLYLPGELTSNVIEVLLEDYSDNIVGVWSDGKTYVEVLVEDKLYLEEAKLLVKEFAMYFNIDVNKIESKVSTNYFGVSSDKVVYFRYREEYLFRKIKELFEETDGTVRALVMYIDYDIRILVEGKAYNKSHLKLINNLGKLIKYDDESDYATTSCMGIIVNEEDLRVRSRDAMLVLEKNTRGLVECKD